MSCVELYYVDVFWDAVALRDDVVVSQNSPIVQFDITPTQPRTQLQNGEWNVFSHVAIIYATLLEQKKAFT